MRIDSQPIGFPLRHPYGAQLPHRLAPASSAPAQGSEAGSAYQPGTELSGWIRRVREQLEVRAALVEQVRQRLESGHYFKAGVAESTVDSILRG